MHVELDVVGERVTFPVDTAALTARAATFTAPPLGVLGVRVHNVDAEGWHRHQAVGVRDVDPGRSDPNRSSFTGSEDGVLRSLVPFGRSFEVRVLDRRVLGTPPALVEGPLEDGEVVELGSLTPDDHVEVHLVTGLAPDDLCEGAIVHVMPHPRLESDFTAPMRVIFQPADFDQQGELMLFVPRAFLERQDAALRVSHWEGGAETCAVVLDVGQGLVSGARLAAPLRDALAAALASTPESELVVTGVVVDPSGQCIPGAKVTVLEDDAAQLFNNFNTPSTRPTDVLLTDAVGAFEVRTDTDAQRFQLHVVGAATAAPRLMVAARGQRDLHVTLGPTAEVRVRLWLDDDVPSERFVIDLVASTDGVGGGRRARRMRALGGGEFVVEAMAQGPAVLRVLSRTTVVSHGGASREERFLVARLPLDLGAVGGSMRANDIDLRRRLVRLDPRAVDALSGAPLTGATYSFHVAKGDEGLDVAKGDEGLDAFTLSDVPVGEATYVPVGEVTLIVDAPGRIPEAGIHSQGRFALVAAWRVAFELEGEHGEAPPEDWQLRVDARLAELEGVDGIAASMLRGIFERSDAETRHDWERRELLLRWPGRWTLHCSARRRDAPASNLGVRVDPASANVDIQADSSTDERLPRRVRLGSGTLAQLSAHERSLQIVAAPIHVRPVIDLEVRDAEGVPLARRRVRARWCWPRAEGDGTETDSTELALLSTDGLGRVSLAADGVPLEHEALELEVISDPRDWPCLYARARWSAREPHRSRPRPIALSTAVIGDGAVRLVALEPAVTGRVLDLAGLPVIGARLERSRAPRDAGVRSDFAPWLADRSNESDAEGRFALYALPGREPIVLDTIRVNDGSVLAEPRGAVSLERGARDVVVTVERLATVVVALTLAEGVGHSLVNVELVSAEGVPHRTIRLADQDRERRHQFVGVEPGVHTLRVSVAASMRELGAMDRSRRVLFETPPFAVVWQAEGATVLPSIDLSGELACTQVAVALDGALPYLYGDWRRPAPIGVFALGADGELERGGGAPEAWMRPRDAPLGGFEFLTRSPRALVLEVAGALELPDAEGKHHTQIVRSARVPVGKGVSVAEVALEALPALQLSVSDDVTAALGPHLLYAIAWRTAGRDASGQDSPTASFDVFDARGELVLPRPAPWPGLGASTVEVELVLVSNPEPQLAVEELTRALEFPRVRREMIAHFMLDLPTGERFPKHVPRAERVLALDASEQPVNWRQVVDGHAAAAIRLNVDIAAMRAARELLER